MTPKIVSPYLIERDKQKTCSVCGQAFIADGEFSISRAFTAHVRKEHPRPEAGPGDRVKSKHFSL